MFYTGQVPSLHLKQNVVILRTFSSLAVPEIVGITTLGAANDEKIANMTVFLYQCSCTTRAAFTNMVNLT